MALKPTVFVGVGTSGTKALVHLRRLLFETYERPGLPIFRFISLETSQKISGDDPDLPTDHLEDFERIQMVHMTVTNTQAIKQTKLNRASEDYMASMEEWLAPEILDIPGNQYTNGANHIRSAGRLCLWQNWDAIARSLSDAYNAVRQPENISRTTQLLNDFYQRRHIAEAPMPLVVPDACDVYLVGSLCGGTGGGVLLDVAYYFRSLFPGAMGAAAGAVPYSVYGIFTLLDSQLCSISGRNIHASNCWAALIELDYYSQQGSHFQATFPDQVHIDSNDTPFDYTMVVTPTNKGGDRFVNQAGQFDEEGLNHMIALKLFGETIAEVKNAQADIRTNWKSADFGKINQNHHARSLASFGMAAVLYPKYRITAAAGSLLGQRLVGEWIGKTEAVDQVKVRRDAARCWDDMLQAGKAEFTRTPEGTGLRTDIENLFAGRRAELIALDPGQLDSTLRGSFPSQRAPFGHRMATDGEYHRLIQGRAPVFERELRKRIDEAVQRALGEYMDLAETMAFVSELVAAVKGSAEACPAKPPDFSTGSLDFTALFRSENDPWTSLLGLRDRAIIQHKERVIDGLQMLVLSHLARLRDYYSRPALERLADYLQDDLMGRLRRMREKLESDCLPLLTREYDVLINPAMQLNVKPFYQSGSMAGDVGRLSRLVEGLPPEDYRQLVEAIRDGESLLRLLNLSAEELAQKIKSVFQAKTLTLIGNFSVADELMERLGEEQVLQLVQRARPYVQYTPTYTPQPLPSGLPNLLIGETAGGALERLNQFLNRNGLRFGIASSPVEHILMFYQEEAGFAIDDLAAATAFRSHHDKIPTTYKDYLTGRYTHKAGAAHFDITRLRDAEQREQLRGEVTKWHTVALDLLSQEFRDEQGNHLFQHQDRSGIMQFVDLNDTRFVERLTGAEDTAGVEQFVALVRGQLIEMGREEVTARINSFLQSLRAANRMGDLTQKSEFYGEVIGTVSWTVSTQTVVGANGAGRVLADVIARPGAA